MARTRLVCNLGMADFFTLPDSGEIWRRTGKNASFMVKDGKSTKAYICVSLYDNDKECLLPAGQRVDLADKE